MPTAPISRPKAFQYQGSDTPVQRAPQTCDSTNTPKAYQFCVLNGSGSSQVLRAVQAAGTSVYGLALADGTSSTTTMPNDFMFGNQLYPQDTQNTFFLVNITTTGGTIGSGTTTQGDVSVGTSYNLIYGASPHTDVQMLNQALTAAPFFKVVQRYPEDAITDFNGRVVCEIVATRQ